MKNQCFVDMTSHILGRDKKKTYFLYLYNMVVWETQHGGKKKEVRIKKKRPLPLYWSQQPEKWWIANLSVSRVHSTTHKKGMSRQQKTSLNHLSNNMSPFIPKPLKAIIMLALAQKSSSKCHYCSQSSSKQVYHSWPGSSQKDAKGLKLFCPISQSCVHLTRCPSFPF